MGCGCNHSITRGVVSGRGWAQQVTGDINYTKVGREASRGGLTFRDEVDGLVEWVKELSGGVMNPIFLYEIRDFARQLPQAKVVKGSMCEALAKAKGIPVLFRTAMLKAMICASAKFAKGDEQALFKSTELLPLSSDTNSKVVKAACEFMKEVRATAKNAGVAETDTAWVTLVGMADVRVVHYVVSKPDATRGSFSSLDAIGFDFAKSLATALGRAVVAPWKDERRPINDTATQQSRKHAGVKVLNADGSWNSEDMRKALESKGFTVGAKVYKSGDSGASVEITKIEKDKVWTKGGDGVAKAQPIMDFIDMKWTKDTVHKVCPQCNM